MSQKQNFEAQIEEVKFARLIRLIIIDLCDLEKLTNDQSDWLETVDSASYFLKIYGFPVFFFLFVKRSRRKKSEQPDCPPSKWNEQIEKVAIFITLPVPCSPAYNAGRKSIGRLIIWVPRGKFTEKKSKIIMNYFSSKNNFTTRLKFWSRNAMLQLTAIFRHDLEQPSIFCALSVSICQYFLYLRSFRFWTLKISNQHSKVAETIWGK